MIKINSKFFLIILISVILLACLIVLTYNYLAQKQNVKSSDENLQSDISIYDTSANQDFTPSSTEEEVIIIKKISGLLDGTIIELKSDGTVSVTMSSNKLWSNYAQANSQEEINRNKIIENIKNARTLIIPDKKINDIFPARTCSIQSIIQETAVVKCTDNTYYLVDFIGKDNLGTSPIILSYLPTASKKDIVRVELKVITGLDFLYGVTSNNEYIAINSQFLSSY